MGFEIKIEKPNKSIIEKCDNFNFKSSLLTQMHVDFWVVAYLDEKPIGSIGFAIYKHEKDVSESGWDVCRPSGFKPLIYVRRSYVEENNRKKQIWSKMNDELDKYAQKHSYGIVRFILETDKPLIVTLSKKGYKIFKQSGKGYWLQKGWD